jgi:hypothetical protein
MTIVLEEVEGTLVGRIYVRETKTSAYIVPMKDNYRLFNTEQLTLINNQIF